MGWGDWVWVIRICRDISKGVIIENGFNLNNDGLEAVKALPRTFFKVSFVNPMSLSQNPPNQGARFGLKRHSVPDLESALASEGEDNKVFNSSAADRKFEPLSERTRRGRDFLLLKCLKACKKHSTIRSVTTSR